MPERWFTPHTARQALSRVRPAAETAYSLYRRLEEQRPARILPEQPVEPDYFAMVARLHQVLSTLSRQGLRVQELRRGALGFPARRAGRPVLLCWRVGEERLGFWRNSWPGGGNRHPVDDDGPWDVVSCPPDERERHT